MTSSSLAQSNSNSKVNNHVNDEQECEEEKEEKEEEEEGEEEQSEVVVVDVDNDNNNDIQNDNARTHKTKMKTNTSTVVYESELALRFKRLSTNMLRDMIVQSTNRLLRLSQVIVDTYNRTDFIYDLTDEIIVTHIKCVGKYSRFSFRNQAINAYHPPQTANRSTNENEHESENENVEEKENENKNNPNEDHEDEDECKNEFELLGDSLWYLWEDEPHRILKKTYEYHFGRCEIPSNYCYFMEKCREVFHRGYQVTENNNDYMNVSASPSVTTGQCQLSSHSHTHTPRVARVRLMHQIKINRKTSHMMASTESAERTLMPIDIHELQVRLYLTDIDLRRSAGFINNFRTTKMVIWQ